ncbi:hypothetical protein SAMN04487821_14315 [Enterococcus malodoratus]|nr:hypothetical protein SAMN04487821_14315 [Enterococcus malodoratus]
MRHKEIRYNNEAKDQKRNTIIGATFPEKKAKQTQLLSLRISGLKAITYHNVAHFGGANGVQPKVTFEW